MVSLLNEFRGELHSRLFYLTDILAPGAVNVLTVPHSILFSSTNQRNPLVSRFCLCNKGPRNLILQRLHVQLARGDLTGNLWCCSLKYAQDILKLWAFLKPLLSLVYTCNYMTKLVILTFELFYYTRIRIVSKF